MITVAVHYVLNPEFGKSGIEKEIKTIKMFGIVIWKKTHYHPKLKNDDTFISLGWGF